MKVFILLAILCTVHDAYSASTLQVLSLPDILFCYLRRSKSVSGSQGNECGIKNFPTNLCTFAIFTPIYFDIDGNLELPSRFDDDNLDNLSIIKQSTIIPGFEIYLNFQSKYFGEVISDSGKRAFLLQNVKNTLTDYNIDGADFFADISIQFKEAYEQFLIDANNELRQNGKKISVSVLPYEEMVDTTYNVKLTSEYTDYIILRTDLLYNNITSQFTVPNNPLNDLGVSNSQLRYNMESSIDAWLARDLNVRKFVPAISISGIQFITQSSNDPSVGLTVIRPGDPGNISYYEICTDSSLTFTTASGNSYAVGVDGQRWVGFSNIAVAVQAGQLLLEKRVRGGAVNDICSDDYDNRCGDGPFALTVSFTNSMFYLVDFGAIGPRETTGTLIGSLDGPTSQIFYNGDIVQDAQVVVFSL